MQSQYQKEENERNQLFGLCIREWDNLQQVVDVNIKMSKYTYLHIHFLAKYLGISVEDWMLRRSVDKQYTDMGKYHEDKFFLRHPSQSVDILRDIELDYRKMHGLIRWYIQEENKKTKKHKRKDKKEK